MGAYRFITGETTDTKGIIRTADSAILPNDVDNVDWRTYIDWKNAPNTPDPFTAFALSDYRLLKKEQVDKLASNRIRALTRIKGRAAGVDFMYAKMVQEAFDCNLDGSPTAAEYPILNEMIPDEGASLAAVATAILTEWDAAKVNVGKITAYNRKKQKEIEVAASVAAINTIMEGLTWPA